MGDEDRVAPAGGGESFDDGHIAAADGIHRVDTRIGLQRCQDETTHAHVKTVAVVDLDQVSVGVSASHGAAESHLPLLFAAEEVATQGDQDVAGPVTQPLRHEVGGGCTCCPVVNTDVGQPLAAGQVGYQRHDGDAGSESTAACGDDLRQVGRLQDDA